MEDFFLKKNIKKKDRVLDIGCWDGKTVERLMDVCNPYGIDIDEKKLNLASKTIRKRLFLGDITKKEEIKKIKALNKKFDLILLTEVLEHIKDDETALKNINSLLKKRGKLFLTTPKSILFFEFWDPAWVRWKLHAGQMHRHYSRKELKYKLKKSGFSIKEIKCLGKFRWLVFRWMNAILKNIFKSKKIYSCKEEEGFFDWKVLAIKNE